MEIVLALAAIAAVGWWLGRFRRRRRNREPIEELGGFIAGGLPVALSQRDEGSTSKPARSTRTRSRAIRSPGRGRRRRGRLEAVVYLASSTNRQSAFASRMCSIVRACTSSSRGAQTRYARHCARETATLSRFRDMRKSIPRGAYAPLDVAIEKKTTAACWP